MKKIKNYFEKILNVFKKAILSFKVTIITIIITSFLYVIFSSFDYELFDYILKFSLVFCASCFLIETYYQKEIKTRNVFYVLAVFLALLFTAFFDKFEYIEKLFFWYLIASVSLGIYFNYRNNKKDFHEYCLSVFSNLLKVSFIYGVLAFGVLVISLIFNYLILDNDYFDLISKLEVLLLGCYYLPNAIYAFSHIEKGESRLIKTLVKKVLIPLVMVAFLIIYLYILKIIIMWKMPSNEVFRILAFLFIVGIPVCLMNKYYKAENILDKISDKAPFIFVPFVFLQVFSLGIRILSYGVTEVRYLGIMFLLLEVVYIYCYLRKVDLGKILIVLVVISGVALVMPYFNMDNIAYLSQVKGLELYKEKSDYSESEQRRILGSYNYLLATKKGKNYINENLTTRDIEVIKGFNEIADNYLYGSFDLNVLEVAGYQKMYLVQSNKYYDNKQDLFEVLSHVTFDVSGFILEIDMYDLISDYIKNHYNIDEYMKNHCELIINEDKKLIITSVSLQYNSLELKYYNFVGYLLEK